MGTSPRAAARSASAIASRIQCASSSSKGPSVQGKPRGQMAARRSAAALRGCRDSGWTDTAFYRRMRRLLLHALTAAALASCAAAPAAVARVAPFPGDSGRAYSTSPARGWRAVQWSLAGPFGIGAQAAWTTAAKAGGSGGRGVRVAIVDSGVAYERNGAIPASPDLRGARVLRGRDFVDGDRRPLDESGHGTLVASIIAARANGVGMIGVAYRAELLPVRVVDRFDGSDEDDIAHGIRYAIARGADVINLSVQGPYDERRLRGSSLAISTPVREAIEHALRLGVVVVAAAGNDDQGDLPGKALDGVIFVGATTEHGCRAEYSNRGPGLDLVAPGGGPDAAVPGDPNCRPGEPEGRAVAGLTFDRRRPRRAFAVRQDLYGTSMAAPHVTGTVALLLASGRLGPRPSPRAVERHLRATARDLGPPGHDRRYGAGLLDAAAALAP
jgi:serine protease